MQSIRKMLKEDTLNESYLQRGQGQFRDGFDSIAVEHRGESSEKKTVKDMHTHLIKGLADFIKSSEKIANDPAQAGSRYAINPSVIKSMKSYMSQLKKIKVSPIK